jgi:ATP-binding cassette, subfamily B, bacterial
VRVWGTFWQDPDQVGRAIDLALIRRGWAFVRPYRGTLLLYLVATGAGALLQVVPALIIRQIVDQALPHRDSRDLALLTALLVAVFLTSALLLIGQRWLSLRVGSNVILSLRLAVYRQFQRMPMAFFTRARQGMIQSRLVWEVLSVEQLFTDTLSSAFTDALGLLATLVAMFALSPLIAVAVLLLVPLVLIPADLAGRRNRQLNRDRNRIMGEINTHIAERLSVSGALLAMIFGGHDQDLRRFDERGRAARRNNVQMQMFLGIFMGALSLTGSLALVAIYFFGGSAVIAGSLSVGTLIALATLAQRVYGPVLDLASIRLNLVSGLVALERIFEVLDKEPMIKERLDPVRRHRLEGRVEAEGVWFRYPAPALASIPSLETGADGRTLNELPAEPSAWILSDVSLSAEPGTVTALVGPTGAGKTTLCYLLARLYDVERGAIRIDGVDVRDLALDSLIAALAMVPQDPHLFHDTVRANLRYARPEATDEEVNEACRKARIHELIESLPDGYETMTGERGYRFSGGEKQRLAIARAILKDPRILILDEATSHLDSETEALVQEALGDLMAGRTSFVIAHRLSTVRAAHQILVLDRGQIVERGDHASLLQAEGLYRDLYRAGFERPAPTTPSGQPG